MSLLKEIEDGACDKTVDISTVLRKCQVLMSRLDHQGGEEWIEHELNGYPKDVAIPDYRKLHVTVKGSFVGYTRKAPALVVPPALIPKDWRDLVTKTNYRRSVGSLAHLLQSTSQTEDVAPLQMPLGDLALVLNPFEDMECIGAWGEIGTASAFEVVNTVRNRALKLALELRKRYPNAGEPDMDKDTKLGGGSDSHYDHSREPRANRGSGQSQRRQHGHCQGQHRRS